MLTTLTDRIVQTARRRAAEDRRGDLGRSVPKGFAKPATWVSNGKRASMGRRFWGPGPGAW